MSAIPSPASNPSNTDGRSVKLGCKSVWKLFGDAPEHLLRETEYNPTDQQLATAGLIGAVRDVNLDILESEIFVIMGLSGSGKSTLVRCMTRLIEPTGGEILFQGQDLLQASEQQLIDYRRHKMGMVFQHFALLPHLSVLGNVAFPLEIQGVSRADREARARDVIELVGLKGREEYFPNELSGGQQQRVGIARSLCVEPEIWFLDEPFSALDPLIRREMQDEFLRLQSVLRKTIVFITHDFDEAIRLADRIAIMKDGRVIQVGAPQELVMNPADQYVAEFTRDVSRAKVLTARAIMAPVTDPDFAGNVAATATVESLAAQVVGVEKPFAVIANEKIVGQITSDSVLSVLVGRV